jgi:signal transduction histidine kinase
MSGIVFPILYYFFLRPLTLEIKERRKTQIELEEAKEKAQESNKMKSEFIAQMSHEIRTPLNTIMSFSKMIKEDLENKISEEFSNEVDAIDEASKRIIRSIELILDLSEMESDSYSYNPEPFDVYEDVLSNLYEEYIDIAARKGLILKLEKTAHDSVITADKHGVTQIFSNLIDNAIKFTEKGSVEIKIYDDQENSLTVSIIDTGIGISEHFIRELFKPFTQEDHGYTRKFDGMGLGLTLVESCCKINKAEIKVLSSKGKGTAFHITFLQY